MMLSCWPQLSKKMKNLKTILLLPFNLAFKVLCALVSSNYHYIVLHNTYHIVNLYSTCMYFGKHTHNYDRLVTCTA